MYLPSEDSYLLSNCVFDYLNRLDKSSLKKLKVLDMGSGTGIQAETCVKAGVNKENILTADIDKESIKHLKSKGFKTIKTNLFSKIHKKFDLIIFNPPYLPKDEYTTKEIHGGKEGYEIIIKFLNQAKNHLNKNGKILLLVSSLTKPEILKKKIYDYKITDIKLKRIFFEELIVWQLELKT